MTLAEVLIRYQTEPKLLCQFQGEESQGIPLQLCLQTHHSLNTNSYIQRLYWPWIFCAHFLPFLWNYPETAGSSALSKQTYTHQSNPIIDGELAATRPSTKAAEEDRAAWGEMFGKRRGIKMLLIKVQNKNKLQMIIMDVPQCTSSIFFLVQAFKVTQHQRQTSRSRNVTQKCTEFEESGFVGSHFGTCWPQSTLKQFEHSIPSPKIL